MNINNQRPVKRGQIARNKRTRRSNGSSMNRSQQRDATAALYIGYGQGPRTDVIVSVPPTMQFFPDRYVAWATTETNGLFTLVNAYTHTFKINAPALTFGPRVNYSGTYGANAPSGMNYLLSGLNDTGANAPYSRYIVRRYEMTVTAASASATANTVPFIFGVTFTTNQTATNFMSITQLPEQPRTYSSTLPASTTNRPISVANSVDLAALYGLSAREYRLQGATYGGSVAADPTQLAYAQLWFRSFDGSTTGTYDFLVRHRFEIEFYGLNTFDSTIPQLEGKQSELTTSKWGVLGM